MNKMTGASRRRIRKAMRRNFLNNIGDDGLKVLIKGVDKELDDSFPSCKMFFNVVIEYDYLVIYTPVDLKYKVRSAIKYSRKMPKFFALDVKVREI